MRITLCILVILPYLTVAFNGGIKFYELDDTRCKFLQGSRVIGKGYWKDREVENIFGEKNFLRSPVYKDELGKSFPT